MKTITLFKFMLLLFLITGISACENSIDEQTKNISFDNLEILDNVLPPGYYTAIRFASQNVAYTVTNDGKIFKTEDCGLSWIQQESGTDLYLNSLFFVNDNKGYVVGDGGVDKGIILKTGDGGNRWYATGFNEAIYDIYFINENKGFAVGWNTIFKTQDAGETWTELDLNYPGYGSINFFDENTGLLTSGNVFLKTNDGGETWSKIDNGPNEHYAIEKIKIFNNIACFIQNGSKFFITKDKGLTWQNIDPQAYKSMIFFNGKQAVSAGEYWDNNCWIPTGTLCITNNGGKQWERKSLGSSGIYSIYDMDISKDSTILGVGYTCGAIIKIKF